MKHQKLSPDPTLNTVEKKASLFLSPLESFIRKQAASGILLLLFSVAAIALANSPLKEWVTTASAPHAGIVLGELQFSMPVSEWISQGLMSLFFFMAGLEVKREVLAGKLRHKGEVMLLMLGAAGGIVVPALIYAAFNAGGMGQHGWAIPTATDTAFAVGVLSLFSRRISLTMAVYLTAMSIFDDVGAVLIISIFYAHDLAVIPLLAACTALAILILMNVIGIRVGWIYAVLGVILWGAVVKAGIHGTCAGLLFALIVPARPTISQSRLVQKLRKHVLNIEENPESGGKILESQTLHANLSDMGKTVRAASTPLQRWETGLAVPIAVFVLPIFALFNAGVAFTVPLLAQCLSSSVTAGIIFGMLLGKPLGVLSFLYIGAKMKLGGLPKFLTRDEVIGISLLTGIGFTMSIFFSTLSFAGSPQPLEEARVGVFISSIAAACVAGIWIRLKLPLKKGYI